jgi:hypothetical protein
MQDTTHSIDDTNADRSLTRLMPTALMYSLGGGSKCRWHGTGRGRGLPLLQSQRGHTSQRSGSDIRHRAASNPGTLIRRLPRVRAAGPVRCRRCRDRRPQRPRALRLRAVVSIPAGARPWPAVFPASRARAPVCFAWVSTFALGLSTCRSRSQQGSRRGRRRSSWSRVVDGDLTPVQIGRCRFNR